MKKPCIQLCLAVLAATLGSPARLAGQSQAPGPLAAKIDAIFDATRGQDQPGAAVIVLRDGQTVHSRAYGLANVELGVSNTTRTKFRIASLTKTFTALIVLQLVEQGRLRPEDKLAMYIPDFAGGDRITIHHLLSHTAGLPDFIPFDRAKSMQPESAPGERLNYSNIGYIALGKVIAKVTGRTYEEQLREAILAPLGMADTGVDRRGSILKNRASGYVRGPQGTLVNAEPAGSGHEPEAGGLYSTAEDLAVWVKALLAGRIVSLETLKKATTPVRLNDGRNGGYGYGFMLNTFRGLRELGHGGDIDGFNSYAAIYPDEQLAVVVLSNIGMHSAGVIPTGGEIAHRIVGMAAARTLGPEWPPVVDVPTTVLDQYVGRYRVEAPAMITGVMGDTIEFARDGSRLFATAKQGKAEVFAQSATTFYAKGTFATFTFIPGSGAAPASAVVTLAGVREYRLVKLP